MKMNSHVSAPPLGRTSLSTYGSKI